MYRFQCAHCGASFPQETVEEAISKKLTHVRCPYCGQMTEFSNERQSSVDRGFNALAEGDFPKASANFKSAMEKSTSPDVYLGAALSAFGVQTIYDEGNPDKFPQLIFTKCGEEKFYENKYFNDALSAVYNLDPAYRAREEDKLNMFADKIDEFRRCYIECEREHEKDPDPKYQVFIAYEDDGKDFDQNLAIAESVLRKLPPEINRVYLPYCDQDVFPLSYEAKILYALQHSACMIAVTDSDMDFRMSNLCKRFYDYRPQRRFGSISNHNRLLYLRYQGHFTVTFPDGSEPIRGQTLFDLDENFDECVEAVCDFNGISIEIGDPGPVVIGVPEPGVPEPGVPEPGVPGSGPKHGEPPRKIKEGCYTFGSYPQKLVTDPEILKIFKALPLPDEDDPKGWNNLLGSDEFDYTPMWYIDKTIGTEKYRAVFANTARKPYLSQRSQDNFQKENGYRTWTVYCFHFEPIYWSVLRSDSRKAELVSDLALDSTFYNKNGSDWQESHLRDWLNNVFAETAFTEDEFSWLFDFGGDSITLLSPKNEVDNKFISGGRKGILGSDYFKFKGGRYYMGGVNSYWLLPPADEVSDYLTVAVPNNSSTDIRRSDSTMVGVLPKICIALN